MDELDRITIGHREPAPEALAAAMKEIAEVFAYGRKISVPCLIHSLVHELQYHHSDRLPDPPLHLPDAARWAIRRLCESGRLSLRSDGIEPTDALWEWRRSGFPAVDTTNTPKVYVGGVPDNPDVADLIARLDAEAGSGKAKLHIAREFTGGNESKAKSLLADINRRQRKGKLNI